MGVVPPLTSATHSSRSLTCCAYGGACRPRQPSRPEAAEKHKLTRSYESTPPWGSSSVPPRPSRHVKRGDITPPPSRIVRHCVVSVADGAPHVTRCACTPGRNARYRRCNERRAETSRAPHQKKKLNHVQRSDIPQRQSARHTRRPPPQPQCDNVDAAHSRLAASSLWRPYHFRGAKIFLAAYTVRGPHHGRDPPKRRGG